MLQLPPLTCCCCCPQVVLVREGSTVADLKRCLLEALADTYRACKGMEVGQLLGLPEQVRGDVRGGGGGSGGGGEAAAPLPCYSLLALLLPAGPSHTDWPPPSTATWL